MCKHVYTQKYTFVDIYIDIDGFPLAKLAKNLLQCRRLGSISGSGRSPGEGNGNPFHHSCLENLMDRGAWKATVQSMGLQELDMT